MKGWILIAVGVFSVKFSGLGGLSVPNSYGEISPDQTRLLVMLSKAGSSWDRPLKLPDGRVIDLSGQFPTSGVYDLNTFNRIWEITWFAPDGYLRWNDDFSSMAFLNPFAVRSGPAISFAREGKVFKTYGCDFLLTALHYDFLLPVKSWNWHVGWYDGFERVDAVLHVSTAARELRGVELGFQEFYEFDFETGELISRRVENAGLKRILLLTGVGIALLIAGCGVLIRRLARRYGKSGIGGAD